MLILNQDLWSTHRIVKVSSSSQEKWSQNDATIITQCVLEQIKAHLTEVKDTEEKMVLIVDLSKGSFPPWMQALRIAKFFVSMRSLLIASLDYTIMYVSTESQKIWINRILKIYTPARPVRIVEDKEKIKEMLRNKVVTTAVCGKQ